MRCLVAVASLVSLASCGGNDDDDGAPPASESDAGAQQTGDAGTGGDVLIDPEAVAACLSAAGFETRTRAELLSEQQVADQLELFGETESLTFDASANGFAGGVSFYETPAQAIERSRQLADAAKAQAVVGNAVVNIAAGTGFEDAVAAAESCLDE